jgi:zinc protease
MPVAIRELGNGLHVLVQMDHSAPVVSLQYWVGTGSIHEGAWLGAGLSHLLEHLMFKGTAKKGNSQMAQEIHDLGGHLNAYTSFDRTVYHVDLPADGWRQALDILTDAVTASTLPEEEFEKEKEVIRREFAMGKDDPDRELGKLIFATAFNRHPYRYPIIGHLDVFNQVTRADVQSYYRERYSPSNLSLILCGAVNADEVFAEAEKLAGGIARRPLPDIFLPDEPRQQSPRREHREFPTLLTRVSLSWHIPGLDHDDIPALDVLAMLLSDGRSSRLMQSCVEKSGLAEEVEAYAYSPAQIGLFGVEARCKPDNREPLLDLLRCELNRCQTEAPRGEEIDRAKRLSVLHQLRSMKSMSGKAASLGRGWLLDRNPYFSRHFLDRLQRVTPEDVQRVANHYIDVDGENMVVLDVARSMAHVPSPVPPQGELLDAARPVAITPALRGLYLTSNHLPLAALRATIPSGLLQEAPGQAGINRLASQMLIKGTRQRTAEQLALDVEQLGGTFGADSGNNSATCAIELLASDWERGLDILCELLAEPHFTAAELATERRRHIAELHSELDHPMSVARNLLRAALYPGHPYATPVLGTESDLTALSLEQVDDHAKRHFFTSGMILSAAGPIDPEAFAARARERLAGLPVASAAAGTPSALLGPWADLSSGPIRIERLESKEQAVLQVAFPTASITHPDMLPLTVLDEALSDLGSRLFIRIREELGLAYFVGTSQFLALAGGYFFFYVGTDPAKRREIEGVLLAEIQNIAHSGITQAELNRARAKLLSQEKIQSQNPAHVAYSASLDELFGLGFDYARVRRQRLLALTLEEVNAAARKYFLPGRYALAIVSPS